MNTGTCHDRTENGGAYGWLDFSVRWQAKPTQLVAHYRARGGGAVARYLPATGNRAWHCATLLQFFLVPARRRSCEHTDHYATRLRFF